tara:strand:- start:359 stop:1057 length:699 start_codon:yes stop_codon:yes gene_type:complete
LHKNYKSKNNVINHIAFIMDGNGRWAIKNNKKKKDGHKEGIKACIKLIKSLDKLDVHIDELSFYVFSSENWNRPLGEIKNLFKMIEEYYKEFELAADNKNLKIRHYGSRNKLSKKILNIIDKVTKKTNKHTSSCINLFFNYGSRDEIINAIKKSNIKNINKKRLTKNLYTYQSKDPDLIIRTGGEYRLSNFLLWQSAYSELYFTKKLWPDFNITDLKKILLNFKKRNRNFGK